MNTTFFIILILSIIILIYLYNKKVKNSSWFLKITYQVKVLFIGIIYLGLGFSFFELPFKYLTYPKYIATTDGYDEYNITKDDGSIELMCERIYRFNVHGEALAIVNNEIAKSVKSPIDEKMEVLYKDGDFILYEPRLPIGLLFIGIVFFYSSFYFIRADYEKSNSEFSFTFKRGYEKNENE